jgi:hypothetical protein
VNTFLLAFAREVAIPLRDRAVCRKDAGRAANSQAMRSIRRNPILCLALCVSCCALMVGCEGRAHVTEASSALRSSEGNAPCGSADDGLAHAPPRFNDFIPPARGGSYVDPQFGCAVIRLTDGKAQFNLAVHHQYSSISAVNQDDTRVMLMTEWGQGVIVDRDGNIVVGPREFPGANSGNLPWARNSPDVFYYTRGNALYKGQVSGHTVKSSVLHVFAGYSSVIIPDQEDLSEDGEHLWIVAGTRAFFYTISANTLGQSLNVGVKDVACGWHKIQITPSNKMLITWACNGGGVGRGQEIYDTNGILYWHMFDNSLHTDVGSDLSGNEIAIVGRIPDTYKDDCPSGGGADIVRLDPPHMISCLVDLNWASAHISYRDSARGWVAISFFDQAACPSYSCFAEHLVSSWPYSWKHFYDEVILVKIDGSAVVRLIHHRSRSAESYWAQSRASISRDGRYVVFDSNMNINDTGLNDYSDVYLIKVQ